MPVIARRKKKAAQKQVGKKGPHFRGLVEKYEKKFPDNSENALSAASKAYSQELVEFDRQNPSSINKLFKQKNLTELYLRHLAKKYPRMTSTQINALAHTIRDSVNAQKSLENPLLGVNEKRRLKANLFKIQSKLRHSPELSPSQRQHFESGVQLIKKRLSNPDLKPGQKLFYKWILVQSEGAKGKLVKQGLRVAANQAQSVFTKYRSVCKNAGITLDDCIQEGAIGLIDAAEKYKPSFKVKFSTYSGTRVRGQILDMLREQGSMIKLSRKMLEKIGSEAKFAAAKADLYEKIETASSQKVRTLAIKELAGLERARNGIRPISGNQFIESKEVGKPVQLFETLAKQAPSPLRDAERVELKKRLVERFEKMPGNAGKVMILRYLTPHSPLRLKEVGRILNISEGWVSQLHQEAIMRLAYRPDILKSIDIKLTGKKITKKQATEISKKLIRLFGTEKRR